MSRRIRVLTYLKKFSGGPKIFRERISIALNKIEDIKIIHDPKKKFDIEIVFLRQLTHHRKPQIIRVDGCYYERKRLNQNNQIQEAINKSNAIIFQSDFSKNMCESFLKIKKPSYIVHNGIDFDTIKDIKPTKSIPPNSFVTCAGWRENKRPISTILGFEKAGIENHLYMIGDYKHIPALYRDRKKKNIHLMGKLGFENIIGIMKACRYQIHLCHIDSCPNAVIEGLACGLNVLCTNLGGTRELVRDNGVVMDVDTFNYEYIRKMAVDNLKPETVAKYIHKVMEKKERANCSYLGIDEVAKKYAEIIRKHV